MPDMLLDTTVFEDLRNGDSEARKLVEAILDDEITAAVSPMTVCELWHRGKIDRRVEIGFLSVLRFVEEVEPDIEVARTAGLWLAEHAETTSRDPACVAVTAATAKRLGVPICTRDPETFKRFGVSTTSY